MSRLDALLFVFDAIKGSTSKALNTQMFHSLYSFRRLTTNF